MHETDTMWHILEIIIIIIIIIFWLTGCSLATAKL